MQPVELTVNQYSAILRLIKKTHADFTHCERVLKEVDWDEEKASNQLDDEKAKFAAGTIKFNAKKEII
jgi:hypothetical protein